MMHKVALLSVSGQLCRTSTTPAGHRSHSGVTGRHGSIDRVRRPPRRAPGSKGDVIGGAMPHQGGTPVLMDTHCQNLGVVNSFGEKKGGGRSTSN